MNRQTILRVVLVVVGAVLTLVSELHAAEARTLKLTRPMVVQGIYLRAAVYDFQWERQATHVTVTFSRQGRAVATVQGEISTFIRTVVNDTFYFSRHPDGCFYIRALAFAHTNKGIVFRDLRSHPNAANNSPAAKAMLQDGWPNFDQRQLGSR